MFKIGDKIRLIRSKINDYYFINKNNEFLNSLEIHNKVLTIIDIACDCYLFKELKLETPIIFNNITYYNEGFDCENTDKFFITNRKEKLKRLL